MALRPDLKLNDIEHMVRPRRHQAMPWRTFTETRKRCEMQTNWSSTYRHLPACGTVGRKLDWRGASCYGRPDGERFRQSMVHQDKVM